MLTLPTLLRDSSLAALGMGACALVGVAGGAWSPAAALAVAIGAAASLINLGTLGWAVASLGTPAFGGRLAMQQLAMGAAVVALLVVGVPALGFTLGFMCFFPAVVLHAVLGLRAGHAGRPAAALEVR
ncbi:MAG: hypothetical protein RLZZ299_1700 [Pseudomonadota bacterium]|jgi:hypothetical protein